MNHFLLPPGRGTQSDGIKQGAHAMELLINDVLKLGGSRSRLHAKAFGGARMVAGLSDVGQKNIDFTLEFLKKEDIFCETHSLGGDHARHIMFWPATGRAMQKVRKDEVIEEKVVPVASEAGNGLELF